jgi:hypothetical protein
VASSHPPLPGNICFESSLAIVRLAKAPRKTGCGLTSFVDFASRSVHLDEQNRPDLSNHDIHEPGLNDIHDPFANGSHGVRVITKPMT